MGSPYLAWVRESRTVKTLREFLNSSKKRVDEEVFETLLEDVDFSSKNWESKFRKAFQKDIPRILMAMFREAGFSECKIYDLKDGVTLPEYLANCTTRDGTKVAIELDVEYDPETESVDLLLFRAYKNSYWKPDILVYYTDVTPKK